MDKVENFERIEAIVNDGSIHKKSVTELRGLRQSLLSDTPLSDNPRFEQRWQRVHAALSSRLDGRIAARRFRVQVVLALLTLVFVVVNLYTTYLRALT